ncbi:homeobox protein LUMINIDEPENDENS [Iris pallida]|uniref:Homeobox protein LUMINIDEPENDENS n=1 Tax=Iris pallida TaxID=29817 RepID=A0AAX6E1Z3_IRIPA|nr:homeobox protein LUMINIDEPENDENS [Iris pallida]
MALVPVVVAPADGALVELEDIGSSVESLARVVESQKSLFHSQIDQLQKLVVAQCKLTGVNPLSQEMAAGALSIKIGKRPRDMLNPKAIKYMQSIFSIKDTIGKKETREISALCGITVTQVRDYISSQRSRVRKLVNLSRDKATRLEVSPAISHGCPLSPDQPLFVSKEESNNTVDNRTIEECTQVLETSGNLTVACAQVSEDSGSATTVCTQFPTYSGNTTIPCRQVIMDSGNTIPVFTQVPGNMGIVIPYYTQVPVYVTPQYSADAATVCTQNPVVVSAVQGGQQNPIKTDLNTVEGGPSSSQKEETIPGVDSDDKRFLENIFNLMRKDQTFSGQVKLMEWILQIHNTAVLSWFSTKGGITILATWLSQAALEEQTTVLLVLFKVLCHLPLHKALPAQMSAILQTVNRLRFYRTSDISNRAKILLSRWSKMFVRSQALRNPSSRNLSKNAQELIRKDRISEILGDESWQSKMDLPEEILALAGSTDGSRKQEPKQAMKLLEFSDGPTKKHGWNVSSTKIKERRKVRLVENPDHKMAGRGLSVARAVPSNQSRPMSADDIQKAKMRAMYMQDKYGKTETPPGENNQQKAEPKPTSSSQANSVLPANRVLPQLPQIGTTEVQRPTKSLPHMMETPVNPKPNATSQEQLLEKLKKDRFRWQTPPEVRINPSWRVGAGENSKEVEIQTQRNGREKETLYSDPRDIPPNPKEPWDIDMDFDDSLTMEIPLEQETDLEPPDAALLCSAPAPAPVLLLQQQQMLPTGPSSSTRDDSRAAAVEEPTASTSAAAAFPCRHQLVPAMAFQSLISSCLRCFSSIRT